MVNPYFQYLPRVDLDADMLTPEEEDATAHYNTVQWELEDHLKQTASFQTDHSDEIKIPLQSKTRPCSRRDQLVEKLAQTLLKYEMDCCSFKHETPNRFRYVRSIMRNQVPKAVDHFKQLRENKLLPANGKRLASNKRIDAALRTLTDVLDAGAKLQLPTPRRRLDQNRLKLYEDMRKAFERYARQATGKEIDCLIAKIFLDVGIVEENDDGAIPKIAQRLRKQYDRRARQQAEAQTTNFI